MARLRTASDMRQVIKMTEYSPDSTLSRRVMSDIESATDDMKTFISKWYSREDAKSIDLTFSPLGYEVTYKAYNKKDDEFWLSISW